MSTNYRNRLKPRSRETFDYILGAGNREELERRLYVLLTRAQVNASRDSERLDHAIQVLGIDGLGDYDITDEAEKLVCEWHAGAPDGQEWTDAELGLAREITWRNALDLSEKEEAEARKNRKGHNACE